MKRPTYPETDSEGFAEVEVTESAGRMVSTVFWRWRLGLRGQQFESMVFALGPGFKREELDMRRYFNVEEARAGHAELVARWIPELAGGSRGS